MTFTNKSNELETLYEILNNLWINAELFQHRIENNQAVDISIPERQKAKAGKLLHAYYLSLALSCVPEHLPKPASNSTEHLTDRIAGYNNSIAQTAAALRKAMK